MCILTIWDLLIGLSVPGITLSPYIRPFIYSINIKQSLHSGQSGTFCLQVRHSRRLRQRPRLLEIGILFGINLLFCCYARGLGVWLIFCVLVMRIDLHGGHRWVHRVVGGTIKCLQHGAVPADWQNTRTDNARLTTQKIIYTYEYYAQSYPTRNIIPAGCFFVSYERVYCRERLAVYRYRPKPHYYVVCMCCMRGMLKKFHDCSMA